MANVAYIRVSSQQQDLGRQKYLFSERNIKIDKIFEEKISAKNMNRPEFKQMMDWIREGDVLYIESFSRLARNTRDLLDIVEKLKNKSVKLVSLKENFDTATPQGKLMLSLFASLYEFERECMLERQKESYEERRSAGLPVGRPKIKISKTFKKNYERWAADPKTYTATKFMQDEKLSRTTFYRLLNEYKESISNH